MWLLARKLYVVDTRGLESLGIVKDSRVIVIADPNLLEEIRIMKGPELDVLLGTEENSTGVDACWGATAESEGAVLLARGRLSADAI